MENLKMVEINNGINKLDPKLKKYIQDLQRKNNLYKKSLKKIYYDIDHLKKDSYDQGEASEELLIDIKDTIIQLEIQLEKDI